MVFLPLLIFSVRLDGSFEVPVGLLEVEERDVVSEVERDACQRISTQCMAVLQRSNGRAMVSLEGTVRLTPQP